MTLDNFLFSCITFIPRTFTLGVKTAALRRITPVQDQLINLVTNAGRTGNVSWCPCHKPRGVSVILATAVAHVKLVRLPLKLTFLVDSIPSLF